MFPSFGATTIRRNLLYFTMHAISTAAFVSVLALVPSLAAAIPATNPTQQPQCTQTYTVPQAEPCDTLVAKLGLSQADILSLNSGLSCDGPIPAGKVLCIKQPKPESLLAQKPAPACKTQATATDTSCDALATKFGLTRQKFVEYNDNVNSDCTNLVPGQAYCVALD
ncbi:hypothetical protein EDB92DRAFT_1135352 [Lactarius akahatsu]|uniref:LysM domain-containing protein n=1 Tax=Lactarius akahatsu TaxID=416441 RepID=A0AAD4LBV3_9AGAM|nr:hypothetical protein EDB92DRAFT_1135352 [Lactarius akahatsu]